jgi:hypothetical protein
MKKGYRKKEACKETEEYHGPMSDLSFRENKSIKFAR